MPDLLPAVTPINTNIPLGGDLKGNPLGVTGPAAPAAGSNPLSMVDSFADVAGKMNQLKLFNQTYAARQRAGQIMATAPDVATGLDLMQKDPQVAAFAPEIAATTAGTLNVLTQQRGQIQSQGNDAFTNVIKGLPAVLEDPSQWAALTQSTLALANPQIRPQLAQSLGYLQKALSDPMPDGSPATRADMEKRLAGWTIAGGAGDAIPRILGAPAQVPTGGEIQTGTISPAQGGVNGQAPGEFTAGGNPLKLTLPPQIPQGPSGPMAPVGGQYGLGAGGDLHEPETPGSSALAGDGKPLLPPDGKFESPSVGTGLGGLKVLSRAQQTAADDEIKDWGTTGLRAFNNANQTMALLTEMDHDYDTMARGGGFLVPGTAADIRGSLGKLVNTLSQATGSAPPFDPSKVASIEQFTKDTRRMGLTVLTTMLGNQREAAQTINNITEAVPGINNTYLGGKLLIGSIRAATQRAIDQRNFENAWQSKNQGNLTGAEEAFNAAHPAQDYANQVLGSFGMTEKGFASPDAVLKAVQQGYLTRAQASTILKSQFPSGPKGK